ncbi:MAG: FkbM family methyltransferase [Candidatus Micrarchaeota archaeon]|nr:FkbM family methyltransferase [Candidatus Micrarchaeota archaeon]
MKEMDMLKNLARQLKLNIILIKHGIEKMENDERIVLKKSGRIFSWIKERKFLDNYAKIMHSIPILDSNCGTSLCEIKDPEDETCKYIKYEQDHETYIIPSSVNGSVILSGNLDFFKLELPGYLKNYHIKKGDIVVDAGAYHGLFALVVSKMIGENGKVICLEPDNLNIKILRKTMKINNCNNVIALENAIWSKDENLDFAALGNQCSTLFEHQSNRSEKIPKNSIVKGVSLQSIMTQLNIKKIDFVKMDIEGAELEVIEGCLELLKTQNINFAIASYHLRNGQKTCYKLEEMFKSAGYGAITEYPEHLTTYGSKNLVI